MPKMPSEAEVAELCEWNPETHKPATNSENDGCMNQSSVSVVGLFEIPRAGAGFTWRKLCAMRKRYRGGDRLKRWFPNTKLGRGPRSSQSQSKERVLPPARCLSGEISCL